MNNKLRLIVWEDCNRCCEGCCNQDWNLKALPICTDFSGYDEILLTGGEPMLYPDDLIEIIKQIKQQNQTAKIFIYTADVSDHEMMLSILEMVDGITLALHENTDIKDFIKFDRWVSIVLFESKSMRLNVFNNVKEKFLQQNLMMHWKIKYMDWIKNCPLPEGETLMRLDY